MKKNEFNEMRKKPMPELEHELEKVSARVRALKADIAMGKVKSLKELYGAQKSAAQLMTVLEERSSGQ